jgi:hypothetical protein
MDGAMIQTDASTRLNDHAFSEMDDSILSEIMKLQRLIRFALDTLNSAARI